MYFVQDQTFDKNFSFIQFIGVSLYIYKIKPKNFFFNQLMEIPIYFVHDQTLW